MHLLMMLTLLFILLKISCFKGSILPGFTLAFFRTFKSDPQEAQGPSGRPRPQGLLIIPQVEKYVLYFYAVYTLSLELLFFFLLLEQSSHKPLAGSIVQTFAVMYSM